MNDEIDETVKQVLSESHQRVEKLLGEKEKQLRRLAKALYEFDYLDDKEIDAVISGEELTKAKVREFKLEWYKFYSMNTIEVEFQMLNGQVEKLVVSPHDDPQQVSEEFVKRHGI